MNPSCLFSSASSALRPLLRQTLLQTTTQTPQPTSHLLPHISRRTEATARRLTKKLRVGPSPTFTNSTIPHDHIIFNPPSSLPNIYHTPLKFLPKTDPRRALMARTATLSSLARAKAPLPQPVRTPYEKKYHLDEAQIAEIRRLRTADPHTWTRARLAAKFECSQYFIALVQESPERSMMQRQREEDLKKKWGRRKREAMEDRARRRAMWGRDA